MLIKQIRKTLHGFCDASNEAYTAIVYLQIDSDNGTFINLMTAKKKKEKKKKSSKIELINPTHRIIIVFVVIKIHL